MLTYYTTKCPFIVPSPPPPLPPSPTEGRGYREGRAGARTHCQSYVCVEKTINKYSIQTRLLFNSHTHARTIIIYFNIIRCESPVYTFCNNRCVFCVCVCVCVCVCAVLRWHAVSINTRHRWADVNAASGEFGIHTHRRVPAGMVVSLL